MQSKRKFSQACEQNKEPILNILQLVYKDCKTILEVGSGSGQHAVYFAKHLPHLKWLPSDLADNLESIQAWAEDEVLENLEMPVELDVKNFPWDITSRDAIFSANS